MSAGLLLLISALAVALAAFLALCLVFLMSLTGAALATTGDRQAQLTSFERQHAGTRYRFGACSAQAVDCSCFAQRLYREVFGLAIPRTTLTQTAALRSARVPSIRQPQDLQPTLLCIGDLVYTYQGSSWNAGARHVSVYAGGGRLLHAWRAGDRVGTSPLDWLRRFSLHGVYRPLGCAADGIGVASEGDVARSVRPAVPLRPAETKAADERSVRDVVDRFLGSWRERRVEALADTLWPDVVQVHIGTARQLDAILQARRTELSGLRHATVRYRLAALSFWGDLAIAEVHYDLDLTYNHHRREHRGIHQTLILQRRQGEWRIQLQEHAVGD